MRIPIVHVVLLNWNGLTETLECLASLRKQDYPSVKVVVVDNDSTNDEASIIEREYPEVLVLRQAENQGFWFHVMSSSDGVCSVHPIRSILTKTV